KDVGPARLVPAGEADEEASVRHVVKDCGFFGNPDWISRRHHVSQRAEICVLHLASPPRVQHARIWTEFIPLGMQMMFDGADAPYTHLIGRSYQAKRIVQYAMIEFTVTPERAPALAVRTIFGRQHRIQLDDHLWSGHLDPPALPLCWVFCGIRPHST